MPAVLPARSLLFELGCRLRAESARALGHLGQVNLENGRESEYSTSVGGSASGEGAKSLRMALPRVKHPMLDSFRRVDARRHHAAAGFPRAALRQETARVRP